WSLSPVRRSEALTDPIIHRASNTEADYIPERNDAGCLCFWSGTRPVVQRTAARSGGRLRRLLASVQGARDALAIADDHDASGSWPMLQGLRALASLREGMCGATRDDDDAVVARLMRHRDCSLPDRGFLGQLFRDWAA